MSDATPTTPAPVRRRWLRAILVTVLVLLLVVASALLWLTRTGAGAEFVLARAAAAAPGTLAWEGLKGSLHAGLELAHLSWQDGPTRVAIDAPTLHLRLGELIRRTAAIESLRARRVAVETEPGPERPPEPLALPGVALPVDVVIADVEVGELTLISAGQPFNMGRVSLAGALRDSRLLVTRAALGPDAWRVELGGSVEMQADWPLDVSVSWQLAEPALTGEASLGGSLAELELEHALDGPCKPRSTGRVELLGRPQPVLDLEHASEGCDVGEVSVSAVRVTHRGPPDDWRYAATATVSTATVAATRIEAEGSGSLDGIALERLQGNGDAVQLDLRGTLGWSDGLQFDVAGRFEEFNAALLGDGLDGRIRGEVGARGRSAEAFEASLDALQGRINGYALEGRARVSRAGEVAKLEAAQLRLGDNALEADGRLDGRALDGRFTLQAPALAQVHPQLGGQLDGRGRVNGTLDVPQIEVSVQGSALRASGFAVEAARLSLATDDGRRADGRIALEGLSAPDRTLGDLSVALRGPADALSAELEWRDGARGATLNVTGAVTEQGVRGQVTGGRIEVDPVGVWDLAEPFAFEAASGRVTLGAHAWQAEDAALRVDAVDVEPRSVEIAARLETMPLAPLGELLPSVVGIEGTVDASVDLARRDDAWRGALNWTQTDTRLRLIAASGEQTVAFPQVAIGGRLDDRQGELTIDVVGDNGTRIDGRLTLNQANGALTLDGETGLRVDELAWLEAFTPGVAGLEGRFELLVDVGGTLAAPALAGRLGYHDGALTLTNLGVRLEEINLTGGGEAGEQIAFEGSALAVDGAINVAGTLNRVLTPEREITLSVDGESARVVDWGDQKIWVSPDLDLRYGASGATIEGTLGLPRAEIRVRDLPPSVVSVSPDVRVEGRAPEEGLALPIAGRIALSLGENVNIDAFGLLTRLRGGLDLVLAPDRAPHFDGRVTLEDGVFSAFGQKLTVERGNLIYAGPPDNPVLDVQATRKISNPDGDVTAGVRVSGYARAPEVEIYSDPPLPETEALAYLLLGRSSFQSSGSDGALLSRAALGLGLSKSSPVTVGIASGLGLDELSVAGDTLEAAELVAGKQLNDDLYVRYSFGVFSEIGTLLLRYRLSDRLSLEAGASDSQTLDLLYTIEK